MTETLPEPTTRGCVACGVVKAPEEFPASSIDCRIRSARCNDCWGRIGLDHKEETHV